MIAYLDCSTGVSGDKFLGALLDAGAQGTPDGRRFSADDLARMLGTLAPEARLEVSRVRSHGISGVSVKVEADPGQPNPSRTWESIRSLIQNAPLTAAARASAGAVFERLARAEATVHGTTPDEVHFHEVGAIDSILDVVGVCAALDALGVERIVAAPVATGAGTVHTSHGVLGVPAPATALLLVGMPAVPGPSLPDGSPAGELTTPTGAALLGGLDAEFGPCLPMVPRAVGHGAGTRDIGTPNVCRVVLGDAVETAPRLTPATVTLLETNLDHLSPEQASFAVEQLLAEGALDAWLAPIVMKKGRSAVLLSVLCPPDAAESVASRIVALTGTLGVRRTVLERFEAEREVREVATPWGIARVKIGPAGAAHRVRPEHDDVARIAAENGLPYGAVRDEIARAAEKTLADD